MASEINFPVRVMIMDDDFFALKWNTALLMRDIRTTVVGEAETPGELLRRVLETNGLDVILIDTEYSPNHSSLEDLVTSLTTLVPKARVVCLSQYGDPESIRAAVNAGARGFLLKPEIRMAIVSAVVWACQVSLVITPGVEPVLRKSHARLLHRAHLIPRWKPNPRLTTSIMASFWLRVLYGMRAPLAASEVHLAPGSVERYVSYAYQILPDEWVDVRYLEGVDFDSLSPEDQAFLWFTLPPRRRW